MSIEYRTAGSNGAVYAMIRQSVRNGDKVRKGPAVYLGRVVDKERGYYRNKERGLFCYNVQTGEYSEVATDYTEPETIRKKRRKRREIMGVEFGASYFFDRIAAASDMLSVVDSVCFYNPDTIRALWMFCSVSQYLVDLAEYWWNHSYAQILYPDARLDAAHIREALEFLGSDEAGEHFLSACSSWRKAAGGFDRDAILISTALSDRNGIIQEDARLIYVMEQETGLPLYYQIIPDHDAIRIRRMVETLTALSIHTKAAVLRTGYYTGRNADVLIEAGIPFIACLQEDSPVYERCLAENRSLLESAENLTVINGRILYVKDIPCQIGEKDMHPATAYLCMDCTAGRAEEADLEERIRDADMTPGEIQDRRSRSGIFMLISTCKMEKEQLLSLCFDGSEALGQVYKPGPGYRSAVCENEKQFRGYLLLTFMSAVILHRISEGIRSFPLSAQMLFSVLHEHRAMIYENKIVVGKALKVMRDIYAHFHLSVPDEIEYDAPDDLYERADAACADWLTTVSRS